MRAIVLFILIIIILLTCCTLFCITAIHRCTYKAYRYALKSYNHTKDPNFIKAYNPVTKTDLNRCGTACVKQGLITTAPNMSFNNWSESNKEKRFRGLHLTMQFVRAFFDNRYAVPITTGGTSGNSFLYWYNYSEGIKFIASTMRCWIPYGWDPSKKLGIFYGHPSSGLSFLNQIYRLVPNIHVLIPSYVNGDIGNIDAFISFINYSKPFVVETMPNLFFRACELCYTRKIKFTHQPHLISLSGDFIFTCQYEFIKACFPNSIVRMAYGSVEVGQIAQQVDDNDLYLYKVFNEYAYVENTDDGKLVVSRLDYENMPMIRYITDDYGDVSIRNDGSQYIKNLVGKKRYNYLLLDGVINYINKSEHTDIINIRYSPQLRQIQITTLSDSDINWQAYFPGLEVYVKQCHSSSCPSTDRYDTKVLPILT